MKTGRKPSIFFCLWLGASTLLGQTGVGVITTIAGTTVPGGSRQRGLSGDGGPATSAMLAFADVQNACDSRMSNYEQTSHLIVDSANNVYFTDSANQRIRKVEASGAITTVVGTGQKPPTAPVGGSSSGNLVIADEQANRIRQVSGSGQISTIVGSGIHNFFSTIATVATTGLDWPGTLAIDTTGTLYFVELHSYRVAKIQNDKLVTVAGIGPVSNPPANLGDGGAATSAVLGTRVTGIAIDKNNILYIADETNHRIRRVGTDGIIRTIAGTGTAGFSGDGGPATSAQLNMPSDVKLDASGNVYIADMMNHRIRRIDPSGIITTVAGDGKQGRGADSVPATSSSLNTPSAIALGPTGDLYILDWQNYLIRKVSFSARPTITPGAVVNAASFAPSPVPVAPGSIITILGANLADSTSSASSVPLPSSLGGATVQINGTNAPLYYASSTQINAQVPYETPLGTATVTVTTAAGSSVSEPANVGATAPGIFQYDGTRGVVTNQDGSLNGPANAEARGNVVVIYLTGQGAVSPVGVTGQPASSTTLSPASAPYSATIGGANANVLFLGLAPTLIGVAQANVIIPPAAPTGSEVVLVVTVGGQASNTATISVK